MLNLEFLAAKPVACQHIADFYKWRWENNKNLGNNLLRRGYTQAAAGIVEGCNNLFDFDFDFDKRA